MLDRLPDSLRDRLWLGRHAAARWLAAQGAVESLFVLLQDQLRAARVTHVVDVGANDGQYGRLLRRLGFRGRIVSFEPVQAPFDKLSAAASADGNWEVHHCAVADRDGEAVMNVTREDVFSSILHPASVGRDLFPESTAANGTEKVTVCRLESVLPDLVPETAWSRTHLKSDTQGSDLDVLKGLGDVLRHLPSVQVEVSVVPLYEGQPSCQDILRLLGTRGFHLTGFFPVARDKSLRVLEADALLRQLDPR